MINPILAVFLKVYESIISAALGEYGHGIELKLYADIAVDAEISPV